MRFPAKKNTGCPKAPRDFPPRKDGILHPPPRPRRAVLQLPSPSPESVRAYGLSNGAPLSTSCQQQWRAIFHLFQTFLVRHNLDPFKQHSDSELWTALERAHLREMVGIFKSIFLLFCGVKIVREKCHESSFILILKEYALLSMFFQIVVM